MYCTVMQPYCNATQRRLQQALLWELATFHWSLAFKWLLRPINTVFNFSGLLAGVLPRRTINTAEL